MPTYTANSVFRGEVGVTSTMAQDMKIQTIFPKRLLEENRNQLIRKVCIFIRLRGWEEPVDKILRKHMKDLDHYMKNIEKYIKM